MIQEVLRGPATPATVIQETVEAKSTNKFYLAVWRWHFYAGVYVVPFLIMLALTGLTMLFHNQIEAFQYADRLFVTPASQTATAEAQLQAVRTAYADATLTEYIPPKAANRSSQISIATKDGQDLVVFVDPYTTKVLGTLDKATTWYAFANKIHGTILLGDMGDRLIEIAAGFAIVLVITGLYLWWPRNKKAIGAAFWPRLRAGQGTYRLAAPPMPQNMPLWKGAAFVMLLVSLGFPLVGITLLTVLAIDLLILSRVPMLQRLFG